MNGVIAEAKPDFLGTECFIQREDLVGKANFTEIFDFDRIELMQYTGLKDKNGKEIYEGDIIASQNSSRDTWFVSHYEVVWRDSGFMGKQVCSSSFIGLSYRTGGKDGYVVIGNIYENPELLRKVDK